MFLSFQSKIIQIKKRYILEGITNPFFLYWSYIQKHIVNIQKFNFQLFTRFEKEI